MVGHLPRVKRLGIATMVLFAGLARLSAALAGEAEAALRLPAIFADHMVLQRGVKVPVWGWATPREKITVEINGRKAAATADALGRWTAKLAAMKAGGPFVMNVTGEGGRSVAIKDVLVGEVWLCSGQSNMDMILRASDGGKEMAAAAGKFPGIRLFKSGKKSKCAPDVAGSGKWQVSSQAAAGYFSAVGYMFARELHSELKVPVGMIKAAVGGTTIRYWTNRLPLKPGAVEKKPAPEFPEFLKAVKDYEQAMKSWDRARRKARDEKKPAPARPGKPKLLDGAYPRNGALFNGMINPLVPYAIRGVVWYQGESDSGRALKYRESFPAMIRGWREAWGQGDFPFLFVQLPNYNREDRVPGQSGWAMLRESQALTLSVPNTGMAVTYGTATKGKLHPANKKPIAHRLALCALAMTYGKKVVYLSPLYEKMEVAGGKIRIHFKNVGTGLAMKGDALTGFTIAGEDKKWVPAKARIDGKTVLVWSDKATKPVAVRYAWATDAQGSLGNKDGLPAGPFRADKWKR